MGSPCGTGQSAKTGGKGSSLHTRGPADPAGKPGARSVKRLCLDKRISLEERDRLPAIYINGKLAAVWRLGVDQEFLPEGRAVRFIKIEQNREADGS